MWVQPVTTYTPLHFHTLKLPAMVQDSPVYKSIFVNGHNKVVGRNNIFRKPPSYSVQNMKEPATISKSESAVNLNAIPYLARAYLDKRELLKRTSTPSVRVANINTNMLLKDLQFNGLQNSPERLCATDDSRECATANTDLNFITR